MVLSPQNPHGYQSDPWVSCLSRRCLCLMLSPFPFIPPLTYPYPCPSIFPCPYPFLFPSPCPCPCLYSFISPCLYPFFSTFPSPCPYSCCSSLSRTFCTWTFPSICLCPCSFRSTWIFCDPLSPFFFPWTSCLCLPSSDPSISDPLTQSHSPFLSSSSLCSCPCPLTYPSPSLSPSPFPCPSLSPCLDPFWTSTWMIDTSSDLSHFCPSHSFFFSFLSSNHYCHHPHSIHHCPHSCPSPFWFSSSCSCPNLSTLPRGLKAGRRMEWGREHPGESSETWVLSGDRPLIVYSLQGSP